MTVITDKRFVYWHQSKLSIHRQVLHFWQLGEVEQAIVLRNDAHRILYKTCSQIPDTEYWGMRDSLHCECVKWSHASSSKPSRKRWMVHKQMDTSKLGSNTEGSITTSCVGFDRIELTRCFEVNHENDSGTAKKYWDFSES